MHKNGQHMEDIEAHLGVLHNSSMEVNGHLNDLDTGCCWCRDVLIETLSLPDVPHVSHSISVVGGGEEVVGEEGLSTTVGEEEVPLPIQVCLQRARRSRPFCINIPVDPHRLAQPQLHGAAERQWQHHEQVGDARTTWAVDSCC